MILWGIKNISVCKCLYPGLCKKNFDHLQGTKNEEGSDDFKNLILLTWRACMFDIRTLPTLTFCHFKGFEYKISKFQWNALHTKIIKCWKIDETSLQYGNFYFKKRLGYENFSKTQHRDGIYQFSVRCIYDSHTTENWQITPLYCVQMGYKNK